MDVSLLKGLERTFGHSCYLMIYFGDIEGIWKS